MTIVVPVAISLMAGGVDFGLAFTTQATGSKSVRDAARYLGSLPAQWAAPAPIGRNQCKKFGGVWTIDRPGLH